MATLDILFLNRYIYPSSPVALQTLNITAAGVLSALAYFCAILSLYFFYYTDMVRKTTLNTINLFLIPNKT